MSGRNKELYFKETPNPDDFGLDFAYEKHSHKVENINKGDGIFFQTHCI